MKLTKEQYELTIKDPVAFHVHILHNFIELTEPQKGILRSLITHPEMITIAGSKGGKSTLCADITLWAIYKMLQIDPYKEYGLTLGTRIYAMNIAPKEDIAVNVLLQNIKGIAYESEYLSEYIEDDRRNELEFVGNIIARAQGSSSRAGRGYAIFNLVLDEVSTFMDTRGNLSGTQVLNAYAPRLAPFGKDGRLIAITTPQGRSGLAWDMFSKGDPVHVIQKEETHGKHPFRAVFQYATWELNPLPQYAKDSDFMRKEMLRDSWMFDREYGGLFADVVSAFLNWSAIESCVDKSFKLPNIEKTQNYVITGDPGFEHDNYAISMAHLDSKECLIIDFARRFEPPLNMIDIENFYEDLCKRYHVIDIALDQRWSMATIQRLSDKGLPARGITFGSKTDVKIYQSLLELINMGKDYIKLPPYDPLLQELKFLQRIVLADRYRVEAAPGSTDDLADTIALLAYVLKVERRQGGVVIF